MNITFYVSKDKEREEKIAQSFCDGAIKHGEQCRMIYTSDFQERERVNEWTDIACMIGVKGRSKQIMEAHLTAGKHTIYFDKGFFSGANGPRSKYVRISVDSFQLLGYFMNAKWPSDRFDALNIKVAPRYTKGENILICGGSLKYAQWHNLPSIDGLDPATSWAKMMVEEIRKYTKRPIVYSPKPSWQDAVPVPGAAFRRPPGTHIQDELKTTWLCLTYGSNAALDAILAGIPAIVTGDGIAKPMSTKLVDIERPFFPTDEQRQEWLNTVAYNQWSLPELASGQAWEMLKPQIIANEGGRIG